MLADRQQVYRPTDTHITLLRCAIPGTQYKNAAREHRLLLIDSRDEIVQLESPLDDYCDQCRINHVADVANATGLRPQGGLRK